MSTPIHGCPGASCQVCALEQLITRSPLSRILTLNAIRDHHHRQSARVWAAPDTEDDNS